MPLASSLNPDAGRHTVATDPRLIAAAQAATQRSFEEFPYYEARYGARGRSFGLSDGAWLGRLCELSRPDATGQIRWLGRVLAARGMPRILLERFLEILAEEVRHSARHCRLLARGAADLRRDRLRAIPEDRFLGIAEEFARKEIPNFGALLVSAVADEKNGVANAVASIEGWATDGERFGAGWIEAVRRTIDAARAV